MREDRTAEILTAAAGLVRQGWTQGAEARNAAGEKVGPEDEHAVCWSAAGAIERAAVGSKLEGPAQRWVPLWFEESFTSLVAYNDAPGRTAEEVACALEAAAVAREERAR